jgi:hypothetical protein
VNDGCSVEEMLAVTVCLTTCGMIKWRRWLQWGCSEEEFGVGLDTTTSCGVGGFNKQRANWHAKPAASVLPADVQVDAALHLPTLLLGLFRCAAAAATPAGSCPPPVPAGTLLLLRGWPGPLLRLLLARRLTRSSRVPGR